MAESEKAVDTAVTPREACRIASEAVSVALAECGFQSSRLNYKCISQLDTRALNAIQALGRTKDRQACLRAGVKAIKDFLKERPYFLEEFVVDYKVKAATMRNSDGYIPAISISH